MTKLTLSPLPHTWMIDVDGVILRHNGHKQGGDAVLDGVPEFWAQIPEADTILLMTARTADELEDLKSVLAQAGLRYDRIITDLPFGERVVINDRKPSGLTTCHAVNVDRDAGLADVTVRVDPSL